VHIEINGREPAARELAHAALVNYGHYTSLQVRGGGVRGLDLHLARLEAANQELFGEPLDGERVRAWMRHAARAGTDASMRVTVFRPDEDDSARVMVSLGPPASMPTAPQRLRVVRYQRPAPHLKHRGTFGQLYFGRLARQEGFDEALLVDLRGVISEGAISNIGFFDGSGVVWPNAPALSGTAVQLLDRELGRVGLASRRARVRLGNVGSFRSVFLTSSLGVAPVGAVDGAPVAVDTRLMTTLTDLYLSIPLDPL
jgi:branched-subunit amino acid aminotransferase/4-amino-4-deoxychorismate lyase